VERVGDEDAVERAGRDGVREVEGTRLDRHLRKPLPDRRSGVADRSGVPVGREDPATGPQEVRECQRERSVA
jgi:hypothetical protein